MDRKLQKFLNSKVFDKNNPGVYVVALDAEGRLHSADYSASLSRTAGRRLKYYQSDRYTRDGLTYYVYKCRQV
uniref:ORF-22 protein n=1 Tax=Lymantria dispar multicapsid nuclear polyhedrosis virus TaxID=10449 RepID=V9TIB3_NPVLD|nr:ORF-22 protein [Lymantria dispar multiple nucleopolyhedrovirus]AJR20297.1 orf-21 protein [Lymantria dispar multiple nucleopolyhedrovirus]AMO27524.1 hypothetical protein [Lymantria dispar multiple nucleopolyhedrovirus]AMO27698.1 hypothetical protein [Lymantria dispar multiple nucleopolyhedrovirus]AQQ80048.1 hypothetical protein [Lymantria dispar multiple nucleopolyhedrovirus]